MRRKDREIKEIDEILRIVAKCDVCHIGISGDEYPYVVPVNFGECMADGKLKIYFHCASQGKKLDLIERNNRVFIEMDTSHALVENKSDAGQTTMTYESVMGEGHARILGEGERYDGMRCILHHYNVNAPFPSDHPGLKSTHIVEITVENPVGKRNTK